MCRRMKVVLCSALWRLLAITGASCAYEAPEATEFEEKREESCGAADSVNAPRRPAKLFCSKGFYDDDRKEFIKHFSSTNRCRQALSYWQRRGYECVCSPQ